MTELHANEPGADAGGEREKLMGATLLTGLVVAVASLGLFSWLGEAVLRGETSAFDERVRAAVHSLASPGFTAVMLAATQYGAPLSLTPFGVVLAVGFLVRGWPRGALLVVITLAGGSLLDTLLKQVFARARPTPFFDYPLPESPSFPSGHAVFAVCFFGGLAVLLTHRLRKPYSRALVWCLAILLILLIGLSRVYLGVHYPTDVMAGYAVGIIWVSAVAMVDRVASHWRRRRHA